MKGLKLLKLRVFISLLAEANSCHLPAGTAAGGQFCSKSFEGWVKDIKSTVYKIAKGKGIDPTEYGNNLGKSGDAMAITATIAAVLVMKLDDSDLAWRLDVNPRLADQPSIRRKILTRDDRERLVKLSESIEAGLASNPTLAKLDAVRDKFGNNILINRRVYTNCATMADMLAYNHRESRWNSMEELLSRESIEQTLTEAWKRSSRHIMSQILQRAVAEEVGLPKPRYFLTGYPYGRRSVKAYGFIRGSLTKSPFYSAVKDIVHNTYTSTQKELATLAKLAAPFRSELRTIAENGTVELYRGVVSKYTASSVLESWTKDRSVAQGFDGGGVLRKSIPIKNIYVFQGAPSWHQSKGGVGESEAEYIVINGGNPI